MSIMNSPEPNRLSRLINTREAADYLGVSTSTVERLVADGFLTVVKVGKRSKFTYEDLDEFITKNTIRAPKIAG